MDTDTINSKTKVKNIQSKYLLMNLKVILYQSKKSTGVNNYEHPTGTLVTNFINPVGEANLYVRFGYVPHTVFYHTQGQVSVSMKYYTISTNNQVINKIYFNKN